MSPVVFLLLALAVAALGIFVTVGRHRTPTKPESAMEEFRREMDALAPPDRPTRPIEGEEWGGRSGPLLRGSRSGGDRDTLDDRVDGDGER